MKLFSALVFCALLALVHVNAQAPTPEDIHEGDTLSNIKKSFLRWRELDTENKHRKKEYRTLHEQGTEKVEHEDASGTSHHISTSGSVKDTLEQMISLLTKGSEEIGTLEPATRRQHKRVIDALDTLKGELLRLNGIVEELAHKHDGNVNHISNTLADSATDVGRTMADINRKLEVFKHDFEESRSRLDSRLYHLENVLGKITDIQQSSSGSSTFMYLAGAFAAIGLLAFLYARRASKQKQSF